MSLHYISILDLLDKLEFFYLQRGPELVFFSNFIEISPFGWLVPGGTLLIFGGFFSYNRPYYLMATLVFGWFGAWLTFIVAYYLGIKIGIKFADRLNQSKHAKRAEMLLEKHGPVILTTSMLASLTRFWVAFASGVNRFSFKRFLIYSGIASFTWTGIMVLAGYLAGSERANLEKIISQLGIFSWVIVILVIIFVYFKLKKSTYQMGDRQI